MKEKEIKKALSIEAEERGDMCSDWLEIKLLWKGEVIGIAKTLITYSDED